MFDSYLKANYKQISINVLIKTLGTILELTLPAILAYIVDTIVPARDSRGIITWGVFMVVLTLVAWVLNIVANSMSARVSTSIIFNLRQDLFSKSLNLSSRQVDALSTSSLESRMTSDTYTIHRFLGASLRMGVRTFIIFSGGIIACFALSPRLASILIFMIIPILFFLRKLFARAIPMFREVQVKLDSMVQIIRESIRGVRVIKALNKNAYEKERYLQANNIYRDGEMQASYQMAALRPTVNTILYMGLATVIVYGAFLVRQGKLELGVIMAFMTYFIQITNSFIGLNFLFNIYNRSAASWDRIAEVLDMPEDKNQIQRPEPCKLPAKNPQIAEIEFKNVSFSYLGEKDNLSNISFKLYPGETLGLMGPTGSGKTTIIKLLLRQYEVEEGEILIRGINIKDLSIEDLKSMFSGAFQNDFLYAGSIRENIDFGRGLSEAEIENAIGHAMAREFIEEKEDELDFSLASKGVNLSGGQKQRLILSRALAARPEVLILDDSTSALDFRTESDFRKALAENFAGTTTLIVAQRIASVQGAEKIMFLQNGRVSALGSHSELMAQSQAYREIATMQLGREGRDK